MKSICDSDLKCGRKADTVNRFPCAVTVVINQNVDL